MASAMESIHMVLSELVTKIGDIEKEIKAIDDKIKNVSGDDDKENQEDNAQALRQEMLNLKKEIELVKKSAPEEMLESEDSSYFLALAELQNSIEDLKQCRTLSEKSLSCLLDEYENLQRRVQEKAALNDEYKKQISAFAARQDSNEERAKDAEAAAVHDIDHKIRATKKVHKELRSFLAEILTKMAPGQDDTQSCTLARLVQSLWNAFFNDGSEQYSDAANLDHDVDERDVLLLLESGIIERHPQDHNKMRLIDFTK